MLRSWLCLGYKQSCTTISTQEGMFFKLFYFETTTQSNNLFNFCYPKIKSDLWYICRVVMDFELIYWGIGRFPYALVIWLFLMAYNAALYPIFTWWIHLRSTNNQSMISIWYFWGGRGEAPWFLFNILNSGCVWYSLFWIDWDWN